MVSRGFFVWFVFSRVWYVGGCRSLCVGFVRSRSSGRGVRGIVRVVVFVVSFGDSYFYGGYFGFSFVVRFI